MNSRASLRLTTRPVHSRMPGGDFIPRLPGMCGAKRTSEHPHANGGRVAAVEAPGQIETLGGRYAALVAPAGRGA